MSTLRVSFFITVIFFSIQSALAQQAEYKQLTAFENVINALCKDVVDEGKTTDRLTENDFADLPVGIARKVGNSTYVIAIDSAYRSDKGGWFFSAYASITFPGTTRPIAFAAKNIGFSKGGIVGSTHVKLMLASTQLIPINESVSLELPGDGHNYIEFDCDGFKVVNLKGNFIFSDGTLLPDNDIDKNAKDVRASFEINTGDINNILATVNITPFKISGLDDVGFEVRNAVVDYSDMVNPTGFIFPQGYQQAYGENIMLWRGFYLQYMVVRVNVNSDSSATTKGFTLDAHNLIIDDLGVSGMFTATNPLPLKDGSADGWPFSIDQLSVTIQLNKITGGAIAGKLGIPILGDEPAPYTAMVEQGERSMNYRFSIETTESKEFNTGFSAKIRLDKGSVITLEKKDGKFIPSAKLNGAISTSGDVETDKLRFENLLVTSRKPYLLGGEFATVGNSKSKGGGFPLSISKIKLKIYPGQFGISFDVALNLSNSSNTKDSTEKSFSARTNLEMLVKLKESSVMMPATESSPEHQVTRHHWELDQVKINQIKLACHTQVITLDGTLDFYKNDPVYGNGFHGAIEFCIPRMLKKPISVNAYFGTKDDFRYWHLDAYVPILTIPIVPPVSINGIMGGASYRMVRQQPLVPDFSSLGEGNSATTTSNALIYVPDKTAGVSFLAGVTLVIGTDQAANGDIMFEVAFNTNGGLKYAQFNGSLFFMTASKDREKTKGGKSPGGPVYANMSMLYDNDNNVFHSNMKTYINLYGVVKGIGANCLVGEAVIHVDEHDWYTYIGRPTQMFGVSILGIINAETYFMVGSKIENLPLPPPEVQQIFGDVDLRLMRDDVAAAGGKGFAAGVRLKIGFDSGDKLRPFYLMFSIGGGTDVMIRNYGNVECVGRSGKIGINGWYASGQAYVFLLGKIGLRVKKKSFDIVSLGLAALLQATLPNPAWMRGMVSGNYSVLGGLVKGKFNLKFEVGEQCEMINKGSEIEDIVVIADIKPDNTTTDVSVFSAPQVSFNSSIDTEFGMADLNNNYHSYRVKLDEFSVSNNGNNVVGEIKWNETKDVAIYKTHEILPQESSLKAFAKIHWEKKEGNGVWEVMKADNEVFYETKETAFTTGKAPTIIPQENVTFSYPVNQQYNLHIKESGAGYVKLNCGQEYLFPKNSPSTTWKYVARFKDSKGAIKDAPLSYNAATAQADFEIPSELQRETVYSLSFVQMPGSIGAIDQNAQRSEVVVTKTDDENEMTRNSNTLEGTISQDVAKEFYWQTFRTSQFNTFSEKWTSLGSGNDLFTVASGNILVVGKRMNTTEAFDISDLHGNNNFESLVQLTASPDNSWLKTYIAPVLYDVYPFENDIDIRWRDTKKLGVKPLKGVRIETGIEDFNLTADNVSTGIAASKKNAPVMGYYLSYYAYWDYSELLNKAHAKYLDNWSAMPANVKKLVSTTYTDLTSGYYPIDVTYCLPGSTTPKFKTQVLVKY